VYIHSGGGRLFVGEAASFARPAAKLAASPTRKTTSPPAATDMHPVIVPRGRPRFKSLVGRRFGPPLTPRCQTPSAPVLFPGRRPFSWWCLARTSC